MTRLAVFAYGSLASLASAERTLGRPVEPGGQARLAGWRRRWSLARDNLLSEKTFARADDGTVPPHCLGLNIERRAGPGPNGLLLEITEDELDRLAVREIRYDRIEVTTEIPKRGPAGLRPCVHLHRQGPKPRRDAASRRGDPRLVRAHGRGGVRVTGRRPARPVPRDDRPPPRWRWSRACSSATGSRRETRGTGSGSGE